MQNSQTSDDQSERTELRAKVLAAARLLATREGTDGVTLSRVAVEAEVPRASVYGLYARKEDLLMSIVSDDLAALAHEMRGIDWPADAGGKTPESAVVVPLIAPRADDAATVEAVEGPTSVPAPRQRLPRRGELAQLLDAKLEEGDTKEMSRTPDAWLERRLRTFERGLSAMESRQEQVEKNARAAQSAAEETIKTMQATVVDLKERAEAAEAKAKATANELRGALNEAELRIQTVEGVARAALAENHAGVSLEPSGTAMPETPGDIADLPPAPAVEAPMAVSSDAPKSYLAEVRKSVAAASAAAEAVAKEDGKASDGRRNITRYLLGGIVVIAIFAAAAGMAFSKGVSDGRRDALSHIVRLAPHALTVAAVDPAHTPLDRLTQRAQDGDAAAELHVGLRYLNTAPQDPVAAFHWITLAAVHGQPAAQYRLATLYAQGTGTAADPGKALQWYEAAALQGNRKAMHGLAIAYAQGLGAAKNPSEAARWFSRAANLGYVDSQFDLAVLYERGDGVPQSLLDAYKWYSVAGAQGDAESKERLDALHSQLGGDDLAAAQRAAQTFRPAQYDVAAN